MDAAPNNDTPQEVFRAGANPGGRGGNGFDVAFTKRRIEALILFFLKSNLVERAKCADSK